MDNFLFNAKQLKMIKFIKCIWQLIMLYLRYIRYAPALRLHIAGTNEQKSASQAKLGA